MSQSISTKHLDPIASRFLPSHFVSYFIQKNEDERSSSKIYKLSSAFSSLPTPDRLFKSVILLYSLEFSEADVRKKTMMNPRKRERADQVQVQQDPPYHVLHKLPPGDSPYVRAKHVQLVQKDPEAAIVLFWKAINAGDRVDSALKDMAVVMKQQDRAEEAIEAIKSFRDRCSKQAQESLDNVLIDLYKKCGRVEEQIELLKQKLWMIYQGEAFNGKLTKTARSHGRKFQVTIKKETSRILGNLGWAYMQQGNHVAAEVVYRKAQIIDPDANKACNLCLCLIKQTRYVEAQSVLDDVLQGALSGSDGSKSKIRAKELLQELEQCQTVVLSSNSLSLNIEDAFLEGLDHLMKHWTPLRSRRLPIFEEISSFRDQLAC